MKEALFDLLDPNPDILALFCHYNDVYFHNKLHTCTVAWSSRRMTLCAGICIYSKGSCEIRLSEPLLKFRSSAELKETLLHEMIHAYLWLTDSNKDHEDHGPCFQKMMRAINDSQSLDHQRPEGGYHITIYHQFSDEVNSYRKHHWMCTRCGDFIKRAQNRAPSQADCFQKIGRGSACINEHCHWHNHQQHCGGDYEKVAEPDGYKDRRPKSRSRYVQERASDDKTVEQEKDNLRKNIGTPGNTRGDKFKNREGKTSGRMQKGASLETYYSINSNEEREKLVTATMFGEFCVENLSEKVVEQKSKKKRRDLDGDETEEDGLYLTVNEQLLDGASNSERVNVQKDKCTVVIGWKDWYAFESEEDEENTRALDNKRRQRRMPERACCGVQNCRSPLCLVWGPFCSSREMLNHGEIEALSNNTPRQPVLEDGDSFPVPMVSSFESHSGNCRFSMLVHTEKSETLTFSNAADQNIPRELGTSTFSWQSPGQPGTSTIACSPPGEPGTFTTACESTSVLVSSCQETVGSAFAKQTSVNDFENCSSKGLANMKQSKTTSLEKDCPELLVMEARTGKALSNETEHEIGEGFGGKIMRKGTSKRLRKIGGVLAERSPSAACPICQKILSGDIEDANFNNKFNEHIDACMRTLGT